MSEAPSARSLTVAVVGATGLVGQTMTQLLLEREFPVGEFRPLASRADGRTIDFAQLEKQPGDADPVPFSFSTDGLAIANSVAGSMKSMQTALSRVHARPSADSACLML